MEEAENLTVGEGHCPSRNFYNMEFSKRKSPRIPGYDYSKSNYYFVTICSHEKACIFGVPGNLNENGKIAEECLLKIRDIYPWVRIDKYVVMPNHVHAIMIIEKADEQVPITRVVGQYKMSVTKMIRRSNPDKVVWQRSFHDHIIRNQVDYERIWLYIHGNPQKWSEDCFFVDDW